MEQSGYNFDNLPLASGSLGAQDSGLLNMAMASSSDLDTTSNTTMTGGLAIDSECNQQSRTPAVQEEPTNPGPDSEADTGPIDDSDNKSEIADEAAQPQRKGTYDFPPSLEQIKDALQDLTDILKPRRGDKRQKYKDPGLDSRSRKRLEEMQIFCRTYIDLIEKKGSDTRGVWQEASLTASRLLGHAVPGSKRPGERRSRDLRKWVRDFIGDREEVPLCQWKTTGRSLIDDEDLAQEIHAHLQSLDPSAVGGEAIVRFIDSPEMLARLQRKKSISVRTAE